MRAAIKQRMQKQLLNFVRETVGSIRKQFKSIGENFLYCFNQKTPLYSTNKKEDSSPHARKRKVVQFETQHTYTKTTKPKNKLFKIFFL